jgi:putative glutamine amidotransferase
MSRPVIGITANIFPAADRRFYKNKELLVCERSMAQRILHAGGTPLVLPVTDEEEAVSLYGHMIDGLLLTGGTDVDPSTWGGESEQWPGQPERDRFELELIGIARERRRPVLGVCRGLQVLNVALGGTLILDIQSHDPSFKVHRSQELYCSLRHPITVLEGSWLSELFGGSLKVDVNSVHHQAIDQLGRGLEALAWSEDGIIEAAHVPGDLWTRGIQWHPEWDDASPNQTLFARFVEACAS